ncbi:DNA-directed RNA polymerases I and III subunit RPAC2-like [Natator depressus]|uniref:DNA-directed RNA polymerases I and III subunit RPAC2-like n=1 Tax=Natator depressus TaxID=27790 RepID=UPI003EBFC12A
MYHLSTQNTTSQGLETYLKTLKAEIPGNHGTPGAAGFKKHNKYRETPIWQCRESGFRAHQNLPCLLTSLGLDYNSQNPLAESEERGNSSQAAMAEEVERKPLLEMVQADGMDGNCVTFVLHDEDHTLGNSLRYMIMKNSEVEFCGYSITHPSESKINFRIQTRGGLLAIEPFRRGLTELVDVCQHVLSKFEASIKEYRAQREEEMD